MKCIVCDRCKTIIKDPRRCRVITCARPLKPGTSCGTGSYRGDDPQQNDIIWEKEVCEDCRTALEAFFDDMENTPPADDAEDDEPLP